jgi:hypothetical protein
MISSNQSSYLWRQLSALGYRKKEPASTEIDYETPSVITKIINLHESHLNYSVSDLTKAVELQEEDFRLLYGSNLKHTKKLRLVI